MNKVCLTGRLTSEVELKQTQNGTSVCSFTIAVNRPSVKETTDFINCVAWRHNAEFITKYFDKGQMIAVVGVLTSRKFQDQTGKNRVAFEVVVDEADFCGGKADAPKFKQGTTPKFEELKTGDDLPF